MSLPLPWTRSGAGLETTLPRQRKRNNQEVDAMAEIDKEKLIKLLDYWIEHNREHRDEFAAWAEKAKDFAKADVNRYIMEAAQHLDRVNESLRKVLEELKREE